MCAGLGCPYERNGYDGSFCGYGIPHVCYMEEREKDAPLSMEGRKALKEELTVLHKLHDSLTLINEDESDSEINDLLTEAIDSLRDAANSINAALEKGIM